MRTRWLVEPKDEHTNEVLSRMRPGEEIQTVKASLPGNITKEIKVWQVSFRDLTFLEQSKHKGLNYNSYSQEGDGKIRPHPYLLKKASEQKRRKALKEIKRGLAKMKSE
jgi:hypothetical protein